MVGATTIKGGLECLPEDHECDSMRECGSLASYVKLGIEPYKSRVIFVNFFITTLCGFE